MKTGLCLVVFLVLLSACELKPTPTPDAGLIYTQAVASALANITTTVRAATQTANALELQTLMAAPTSTPWPTDTPLPTHTVTPVPNLTGTAQALLIAPHFDGFYLVGNDISPGLWRSEAGYSRCYWKITTRTGDIINNYYGMSGGTMYINSSDFQVQLEKCGAWTYLGP